MTYISKYCGGEKCFCGKPAEHKVEETIFDDDPIPNRHPLTSYICHQHFRQIMGRAADRDPYDKFLRAHEDGEAGL